MLSVVYQGSSLEIQCPRLIMGADYISILCLPNSKIPDSHKKSKYLVWTTLEKVSYFFHLAKDLYQCRKLFIIHIHRYQPRAKLASRPIFSAKSLTHKMYSIATGIYWTKWAKLFNRIMLTIIGKINLTLKISCNI